MLFKEGQEEPLAEIPLDPTHQQDRRRLAHLRTATLPPDVLYGYRVYGPSPPRLPHRFNAKAIVLDPYALAISGGHRWGFPDVPHGQKEGQLTRRGRLVIDEFDWEGDVPPATPLGADGHLRNARARLHPHPSSGVKHPGTFLGLCEKIPHLKALGVTAVQLMPVLEFDELDQTRTPPGHRRAAAGTTGATRRCRSSPPRRPTPPTPGSRSDEFKQMVKTLHRAGIEVILDVVYNHTCEGNENGPTLSFRGLDNAIYYMLDKEGRYYNFSGCGNTLNCNHPLVRDLIIDSLVYLVAELHVDGFRFDLAAILGRGDNGKVLEDPPLIQHIAEHPVLAGTKLIAEAWDAAGLSQLGKFPAWGRWAELNGWFRDDVRRFLRSEAGADRGASPSASAAASTSTAIRRGTRITPINFVTCHDGFTLNDLVSYNRQAQLGQRREQPRRLERQPQLQLRPRGADRRRPGQRPAPAADAELPDAAAHLAGRAVPAAGRRVWPDAAGQQQRLLPGQRDFLGGLGPGARRTPACCASPD